MVNDQGVRAALPCASVKVGDALHAEWFGVRRAVRNGRRPIVVLDTVLTIWLTLTAVAYNTFGDVECE
jgi:hypothetical protein